MVHIFRTREERAVPGTNLSSDRLPSLYLSCLVRKRRERAKRIKRITRTHLHTLCSTTLPRGGGDGGNLQRRVHAYLNFLMNLFLALFPARTSHRTRNTDTHTHIHRGAVLGAEGTPVDFEISSRLPIGFGGFLEFSVRWGGRIGGFFLEFFCPPTDQPSMSVMQSAACEDDIRKDTHRNETCQRGWCK